MEQFISVGVDLAKSVFQVHAVDAAGEVVRRRLRRGRVVSFFAGVAPCRVYLEACASAHYWARELGALGHDVRLVPPSYVKAYVKRGKNDAADAEAIVEAGERPGMRFVAVKTPAQQAALAQHGVRDLLVRQRTMQINALRGHLAEFGIVEGRGGRGLDELVAHLRMAPESELPALARDTLCRLADGIAALADEIAAIDKAIVAETRRDEVARRLMTIPGIGPVTASALSASVGDPGRFRNGRHFAAFLGLVPRQNSTGGRTRLGRIAKQGDRRLRRLLVLGATGLLYRRASLGKPLEAWLARLHDTRGKPGRLVSVALANKLARIVWAVMAHGTVYRPAAAAAA